MIKRKQELFLKIILVFIFLQPILDILSRLAIKGYIPNISIIIKPLFVFGMMIYFLLKFNHQKKKWFIYMGMFGILTIGHLYILYRLFTDNSVILHEFRFMINIFYMIAMFIILFTLYDYIDDKESYFKKIKNTIFYTFLLYFSLYLIAIVTGTSGLTYEYSDKFKLGYKGWYDSGQILGHAFSMLFPIILYGILKPKNHKIIRIIFMIFALIVVSLLGTKVPYYITGIVLVLYLFIVLFIKFFNKEFEGNIFNILLVSISVFMLFFTYKYTPVAYNTDINNKNSMIELKNYDLKSISGKKQKEDLKKILKKHSSNDVNYLKKYYMWGEQASSYLESLFQTGKIHPSNTRSKQFFYSYKKFMLADFQYKIFGIGYLNQDSLMAIESDFFMALFDFGILGIILFLCIPIYEFIKGIKFLLKNIKTIDLETYMLFMGVGIFFCVSIYAGYTYIYTNFSIFLVLLIVMLKTKIDLISVSQKDKIKSIDFLLLHLGYGGIESSTINSANALCNKYKVTINSFYRLTDNQEKNLNSKVKINYLYNGEPNKEKFINLKKEKKYLRMFLEGLKSIKILILKKYLIIKYIKTNKSDAIISTRVEFNILLSKYGKKNTLKIAQEHHYHNNNNKYIKKIKNCYYNIDYLCALTTTLKDDYEKFLEKNSHTKVILLPNMITKLPNKKSLLNNNNIITVSRLNYGKRNNEIIEAFSKLEIKDNKLFIIGDGEEFENLKELIEKLKLSHRVKLLGYMEHSKIEKYMLDSSVFLMASVTEGLPMVLLEAMGYGIPCIAFKTASGTSDIIKNEINGYLVENRDIDEYVERINYLLKDEKIKKQYGLNAIKTAKEFHKNKILKIWDEILEQ